MTACRNLKNRVMAVQPSKYQPLLLLLLPLALGVLYAAHAATQPAPECPTKCGSLKIPFPFGTTKSCSLDSSFLIHCNQTSGSTLPPTPYLALPEYNLTVLNISLNGELRVSFPVASECYYNGTVINRTEWEFGLGGFSVSTKRNRLTAVGCDTIAGAAGWDSDNKFYPTGCVSFCSNETVGRGSASCPTAGCCEASIPPQGQGRLSDFIYITTSIKNHTYVGQTDYNPCGYTFLVEDGLYHFDSRDLRKLEKTAFPVVLDWAVGNRTCKEAQKNASSYACKAENSTCHDVGKGLGYLCHCSHGFRGNPYLHNGCQDINECRESKPCVKEAKCHNFRGSYNCSCRRGYEGDGKINGKRCSRKSSFNSRIEIILIIALSESATNIALFSCWFSHNS